MEMWKQIELCGRLRILFEKLEPEDLQDLLTKIESLSPTEIASILITSIELEIQDKDEADDS